MTGPDTWGPHGWKFLHYVSLGYPTNPTQQQKEKYKAFFILLKDTLPCSVCRVHFAENYDKLPLTDDILSDREKLIKWVIDIHNIVNKMKNKPIVKYEDARKMIDTDVKCIKMSSPNNISIFNLLIIIFIVLLLVYLIIKNKN